ncbi:hypothetical protein [Halobellus rufus]|uniref:hypothetical protein n=1 Tax=Halobellus rufus TaxID=1448860 RepID=UPI00067902CE|nr:hypothetical protein [Halobellus rufus]
MLDPYLRERIRTASDYQLTMAKAELESGAQTPFVMDALDEIRSEIHAREPLPGEEEFGIDPEVVSPPNDPDVADAEETLTAAIKSELRDETRDATRDETTDDTRG